MGVKSFRLLSVAMVAAIAQKTLRWWQGYSVDVTAGLEMFFPFVYLTIVAIPSVIACVAAVRVLQKRPVTKDQLALLSISLFVVALQLTTPSPVMAGFKARMSQFSESEFEDLANSIRLTPDVKNIHRDRFGESLAETLRSNHAILRVSSWRPKIFIDPQTIQIRWGSGLTGALAVQICDENARISVPGDASNSEKLYSNVQLLQIF